MSTHTKGRIEFRPNGESNSYAMLDEDGNWWLSVLMNGEQVTERQLQNLRRLAACWNACDGIPTARIEAGAVDVLAYSMELKAQRDEMLATIIAAASLAHHETAAKLLLDDAIAKATGEKA